MNILFYYLGSLSPETGGVARVNNILAKAFIKGGSSCYALASRDGDNYFTKGFYFPKYCSTIQQKQTYLSSICNEYKINLIIFSNPLSNQCVRILSAIKGEIPIIGHLHNSPKAEFSIVHPLKKYKFSRFAIFKNVAFYIKRINNRKEIAELAEIVSKIVILSPSYYKELLEISPAFETKIVSIPNPFIPKDYTYNVLNKKKQVLYVGRIEELQKRISSLLRIWKEVAELAPDWDLKIVGGGPQLQYWKNVAKKMGLVSYSFEGFQNPDKYYQESQIFLMTSSFEGFPMTLVEAMQFGCVPVAFNSFGALGDILSDGSNGLVIPAFNEKHYKKSVINLINDKQFLSNMSQNAVASTHQYEVDTLYPIWKKLIEEVVK